MCREFSALAKENVFSSLPGCTSFKQESIEKHLKSAAHHACQQASAAKRNPEEAPIVRAVAQMSEEMLGRMVSLFNTAYYVAIEEKPFSDFEALTTLQIKNGSQLGEQYTNRKACKNFISAIAKVVTDDLKTSLSKSPFVSLLMDSSCDVSVREHCNIFVRYVDSASQMACNKLLDVAFMHGTKAVHYMAATEAALDGADPQWREKLIGIATDGASVMRGRHNGLCARLTAEVPGLLSVHCVAHDLQLAIMDAAKELPYMLHFDDTLKALFKYYQYSARRQRGLEAAAEDVGMDKLRKLSKLKDLRWAASEARAVDALVADYRAVVRHLEQESEVSHIFPLCYNHYLLQFY